MTYKQLGRWLYYYYCVSHNKVPKDLYHAGCVYPDGVTGVMGLTEKDIESLNLEFTAFDMQVRERFGCRGVSHGFALCKARFQKLQVDAAVVTTWAPMKS